jgi:hypothetical protein
MTITELSRILCMIGIHRPLSRHWCKFIDCVSGKEVFDAVYPCGKHWLVDSVLGFFGFKIEVKG